MENNFKKYLNEIHPDVKREQNERLRVKNLRKVRDMFIKANGALANLVSGQTPSLEVKKIQENVNEIVNLFMKLEGK